MKFEIDPNELTTDQRTHVAAFITNWPAYSEVANRLKEILAAPETEESKMAKRAGGIAGARNLSEEQRLGDEQKSDLQEIVDSFVKVDPSKLYPDNLNAIFGTPDIAKGTPPLIPDIPYHTVPLDAQGLPWDSRIHSSSKATIADGSWKLRRGVDPAEVEKVKAQLKELMAVPKFTDLTSELMNTPNADNEVAQALVDAARVPVPPAPKSHSLIDQQPAAVTLTDLIGRMSAAIAAGKLTQANVTEICVKHGVSEFHLLSNRPDLLPLIDADMKAMEV